jgi:hypothetical protein
MARREDRIDGHLFRKSNGGQSHIRLFKIGEVIAVSQAESPTLLDQNLNPLARKRMDW